MKEFEIAGVDVFKMDVKGAEPVIFKGMKSVLKTTTQLKIILKYDPHLYADVKALIKYLFRDFEVFSKKMRIRL